MTSDVFLSSRTHKYVRPAIARTTAPFDVLALGAAVVVLTAVCFVAALVPALRAARVDPALILRGE